MSNPGFEAPLSHATEWSRPYSFLPAIESVFAPQLYSGQVPSQSQEDSGTISRGNSSRSSSSSSSNNSAAVALFLDRQQRADDAATLTDDTEEVEAEAAQGTCQQPSLPEYGGGALSNSPPQPFPGDAGFLGLRHAHSPTHQPHQRSFLGVPPVVAAQSCSAPHTGCGQAAGLYEQTAGDSGMVVVPLPDPEPEPESVRGGSGVEDDGEDDEDEQEGCDEGGEEETAGGGSGSGGDVEDGEAVVVAQTASERMAQRRKMKRFRLTHQQTRFLMSEFSKQPHPDAAHRECLSREIPGLSPRQVQVWFQNRRAKIKRLAADDRERVIKMRAVPDDFDNVQALHSPYGAVHGLGAPPLASPVDYAAPSYADHAGQQHFPQQQPPQQPPPPPPQPQPQPHQTSLPLGPAFSLGSAFPLAPAPAPAPHGHASARFGRMPTVPSSSTASSSSMSSLSSSTSSSSSSASSGNGGVTAVDSDPRSQPLQPLLQPLRPSMAWKGDTFDYSVLASGWALQQSPTPASSLQFVPFMPSAAAAVTTTYDGSTTAAGTVRTPSFWELQR